MKEIYAVYCTLHLTKKPEWLERFRSKYDKPHSLHITLKQMAYIDQTDLPKVKRILEKILRDFKLTKESLSITFDKVVLDEQDTDSGLGYIYIFAHNRNVLLDNLQQEIREKLIVYSNYYFQESRKYEYNFEPHITIARDLDSKTFHEAKDQLPQDIECIGQVQTITLSCLKEYKREEFNNPNNFTVYEL